MTQRETGHSGKEQVALCWEQQLQPGSLGVLPAVPLAYGKREWGRLMTH